MAVYIEIICAAGQIADRNGERPATAVHVTRIHDISLGAKAPVARRGAEGNTGGGTGVVGPDQTGVGVVVGCWAFVPNVRARSPNGRKPCLGLRSARPDP